MAEQDKTPPPNPFFEREYVCSLSDGQARMSITFPGGKIDPQDASDVCEWLQFIIRGLSRYALPVEESPHA